MLKQLNSFQGWGFTMRMSWVNHFLRLEEEAVSSSLLLIPTIWFEWTALLVSVNWSRSLKMHKLVVSKECWRGNMYMHKYVFICLFCQTIALVQLTLWLLYCLWCYRREQTAWLRLVVEKGIGRWNLSHSVLLFIQFSLSWSCTPGDILNFVLWLFSSWVEEWNETKDLCSAVASLLQR